MFLGNKLGFGLEMVQDGMVVAAIGGGEHLFLQGPAAVGCRAECVHVIQVQIHVAGDHMVPGILDEGDVIVGALPDQVPPSWMELQAPL